MKPSDPTSVRGRDFSLLHSLKPVTHTHAPPESPVPPPRREPPRRWLVPALLAGAGVVVALAVAPLLSKKHQGQGQAPVARIVSGTPGIPTGANGAQQRWHLASVEVQLDSSLDRLGPSARDAARQAFGAWIAVDDKLPQLTFSERTGARVSMEPDGINSVLFAPIEIAGHEKDLAITIAFTNPNTGEIVEADIVINDRQDFAVLNEEVELEGIRLVQASQGNGTATSVETTSDGERHPSRRDDRDGAEHSEDKTMSAANSCAGAISSAACDRKFDLGNVLTHEVGHFYGLGEDEESGLASMYYCSSACETHKRTLEDSDSTTVATLYANEPEKEAPPPAQPIGCGGAQLARGGAAEGSPLWGLAAGALALAFVRRRGRT